MTISSADAAVVWENRYVFVVESNKKKLARLVACATSVPWQILVMSHTLSTRSYIQFVTRVKFERGGVSLLIKRKLVIDSEVAKG